MVGEWRSLTKEIKHGFVCLTLPDQPFQISITTYTDVEENPLLQVDIFIRYDLPLISQNVVSYALIFALDTTLLIKDFVDNSVNIRGITET